MNWLLNMHRILIVFLVCILISAGSFAQQVRGNFFITGSVKVDQGVVDGTHIDIYRNGTKIQNVVVNRTGNFRVSVDLDQLYRFVFVNDNYYSKTIEIDTHVPAEVCQKDCNFPPYQLALLLYKKVPGVNETQQQIGRISYNPQIDNFDAELLRQETDLKNMITQALSDAKQKSIIIEQQKLNEKKIKYNRLIKEADNLFNSGNLEESMRSYRDAVMIFPDERYPRERVAAAYQLLLANNMRKSFGDPSENNFQKYLNYGDAQFNEKEYTVAMVAFEKVLEVKPDDQSIQSRYEKSNVEVQKINDIIWQELDHKRDVYATLSAKYNNLISQGDQLLEKQNVAGAKDLYAQAATQINENSYALLMLQKIGDIISNDDLAIKLARERAEAEKKRLDDARNQAYNDAINEADRLFNQRFYRDALENYQLALTIKKYELYPKKQIQDINDILAKLQLEGENYNRFLRLGENLLVQKEYEQARDNFVQAHALIPDEKYAQQKIREIDSILVTINAEKANRALYNNAIDTADSLYNLKKYNDAISFYQKALQYEPQEKYPKDQIVKIRGILSREDLNQKRLLQQQTDYDQVIAQADDAFNRKSYQAARSLYQKALQIYPGQDYPVSQIKKIDDLLLEISSKQAQNKSVLERVDFSNLDKLTQDDREEAFKEAMKLGESFFESKDWGVARFYFRRALSLIPNEPSALKRLDETEKMLRGNDVNESKYNEMVKKADESFKTGDISIAKFYYAKALEAKPADSYAKERLDIADQLIRSTAAQTSNREFDDAINKGNGAFNSGNYVLARFFYKKALSLKPGNQLANEKIDMCDKAISQDKSDAATVEYTRNISLADQAFQQKKYGLAINYYKQALAIKPGSEYPTRQLSVIDSLN